MATTINTKELRASLPDVVERVRRGARFTVIYRSRPAFQIVPVDEVSTPRTSLKADSLYGAGPVGRSSDGLTSAAHDVTLYARQ